MSLWIRWTWLLSLLLTLCAWSSACLGARSSAPQRPWIVACDLDNPPFASLDAAGLPQGRDVHMAQELARRLGRTLEWKRMPFEALLPALEQGSAQSVIATMGCTPERAQRVDFTQPYYRTSILVLVRKGAGEPSCLAELVGRTVAAGVGTTSERALCTRLPGARLADPTPKGEAALERLRAREVDAAAMDGPNALELARRYPDELQVLSEPLAEELYCIALARGQAELCAELDRLLEELRADGTLARLDRDFGL